MTLNDQYYLNRSRIRLFSVSIIKGSLLYSNIPNHL